MDKNEVFKKTLHLLGQTIQASESLEDFILENKKAIIKKDEIGRLSEQLIDSLSKVIGDSSTLREELIKEDQRKENQSL